MSSVVDIPVVRVTSAMVLSLQRVDAKVIQRSSTAGERTMPLNAEIRARARAMAGSIRTDGAA
ncbi:hypothetical protein F4556_000325 [Kitasatospora gansuensis]|uniref:Uncharacterized protein n=1 Tax=Kitasatospora gansuensis TaxID=258050 RepID=A0A7W7WFP9_9ACTN|nr:hypothetical protein [Kitasatospora gansuensis]MBB4944790.1 hypothetical protein [Kitasatospora gansuensis]